MVTTSEDRRRDRAPAALLRLSGRHAATGAARARSTGLAALDPRDAVRLVELLGAGTATYGEGEEQVGPEDLADALTLVPHVRAELDETELALVTMARGRGMTWAGVAEALGLGSAQAAQQRFDRLAARVDDAR